MQRCQQRRVLQALRKRRSSVSSNAIACKQAAPSLLSPGIPPTPLLPPQSVPSSALLPFPPAFPTFTPLSWRWTGDWPTSTNIPLWISAPQHINFPCFSSTSSTTVHWLIVVLPAAAAFPPLTPLSLNRLSQCRNCDVLAFFGTCTCSRPQAHVRAHMQRRTRALTSFMRTRLPARLPRRTHACTHADSPCLS